MTSSRSYLIRAIYEWIVDNDCTPYMLVNAEKDSVVVPVEHIENGRIVLNLGLTAVNNLQLGNEWVEFSARFSGKSQGVSVPAHAVLAIYAKENGQGMMFNDDDPSAPIDPNGVSQTGKPKKPSLKVVK
ncbi:MAG: ClpXP protease specificity-enhancing factor [Gammaproteobacteria bacterium]|nr:ClpXP protease specificity-enhancing factor [Gammaproteobacteria bacterium]